MKPTFDIAAFVAKHADKLPKEPAARVLVPAGDSGLDSAALTDRLNRAGEHALKIYRASRYLNSMAGAFSGQNGHGQTFDAACALIKGYDLSPSDAKPIMAVWNHRCSPPWSDAELDHKLTQADEKPDDKPRGYLWAASKEREREFPAIVLENDSAAPATEPGKEVAAEVDGLPGWEDNPHSLANRYLCKTENHADGVMIRYWQDEFHVWRHGAYHPISKAELKANLATTISRYFEAVYHNQLAQAGMSDDKKKIPRPLPVTTNLTGHVYQALSGLVMLPSMDYPAQPCWLDKDPGWPTNEILPMRNAIVHLPSYLNGKPCTRKPTPRLFSPYSLDYGWNPDAETPTRWLAFLGQLWPDDPQSIETLQEWFGLQLVPVTKYQKIMGLIGPKRAGKGTISRVMQSMVGQVNCIGPTLTGLGETFGMQSLIGKLSAIIDDARLSGKSDQAVIAERLLSISGEGRLTIRRMYRAAWTGVLTTRITLISNELPRLSDNSGALPSRFIVLRFTRSFIGEEDTTLVNALLDELPGILLWAIEGWRRLSDRGRFRQPDSGVEIHEEMEAMASPIATFVNDWCVVDEAETVAKADLYRAWKSWCEQNGKREVGEMAVFGRNLRSVIPTLKTTTPRDGNKRIQSYKGVGLLPPDEVAEIVSGDSCLPPSDRVDWQDENGVPF